MTSLLFLTLLAQSFDQRGFIEDQTLLFPQTGVNDSGHIVNQALLRWEASYKITQWLKLAGSFDARADTHRQVERAASINWDDRTTQRPAFALREFNATLHQGPVTAVLGRQIIRWGKTDILTPTDRFAPKDYLSSVVDSETLGIWAARATISGANNSLDIVWQPWFTPSRTPLLNQRWSGLPAQANGVQIVDGGALYPHRQQFGARWNHVASGYEYSLSYFDGNNSLPSFTARFDPLAFTAQAQRYFPQMRMYGADAVWQLPWLTVKAEGGYFTSNTANTQDYLLYIIQLERQVKEWSFVGGYAGEAARGTGSNLQFAPDRGFAKSFVGRAALTIDVNRSVTIETALRAAGSFVRFEYSQTFGAHWRATPGFAFIRGDAADFLGQYRRNSYLSLAVRYSF